MVQTKKQGCLYIVATPIGNLADMTQRAIDTLSEADIIAAEDTRHSRKLLAAFGISAQLVALHDHNERHKSSDIVQYLLDGKNVALISDAGTPMISDPGYHLVRRAQEAGVVVSPVPGSSAVISALSVGGLPANRFHFYGFLPEKQQSRLALLKEIKHIPETLVFYESGRRVVKSLQDMVDVWGGQREVVICRELTKLHESIIRAPLHEILQAYVSGQLEQRGEFVLLVEGGQCSNNENEVIVELLVDELAGSMPTGKLAAGLSNVLGVSRKAVYQLILDKKS